jgi:hypothetical protein
MRFSILLNIIAVMIIFEYFTNTKPIYNTFMDYTVEEVELDENLKKLLRQKLYHLSFIPENFNTATTASEFIFTESLIELNKYFKAGNIKIEPLGGEPELFRSRKNADIYLPSILLATSTLLENPNILSVILNILSSFIYDNVKGKIGKKTAKIELYIEKEENGKFLKIEYNGDAEGIKELEKIIKSL